MIRAIAFDFDGVLAETVEVKTRAFARLFEGEGSEVVRQVLRYHRDREGVSRFEKFRGIYQEILHRPMSPAELDRLDAAFSQLVMEEVVAAPWVEGAREFLTAHRGRYQFMLLSGTPQDELKTIVARRGLAEFFTEVLGSPATKADLLRKVMGIYALQAQEVAFVGDTETDWIGARQTGVRFIWRCASGARPSAEFRGPVIRSLAELDACLSSLEGVPVR